MQINWKAKLADLDGGQKLICVVAVAFLVEASSVVPSIEAAVASRDSAEVQILAHTIKSSSRFLHVDGLPGLAQSIEVMDNIVIS